MEHNELKPCPFCGGKALTHEIFSDGFFDWCRVECKPCGVMMTVPRETGNEGINAWNKRINNELNKIYCKRYKQNHPEKIKEYKRKYRDEHPEKTKEYYGKHSDEIKERSKNYYHTKIKNNPEAMAKRREYCRKWRENRRANDGT